MSESFDVLVVGAKVPVGMVLTKHPVVRCKATAAYRSIFNLQIKLLPQLAKTGQLMC